MEISKCYENLAHAIIVQAAKDYRKARRVDDRSVKRECVRFFRSKWFMDLTNISGAYLLQRLQKEANKYEY